MNKPVFDIVSEDLAAVDWFDCRLVMEVGHQYFHYVVLNGKNSVVVMKYYQFIVKDDQEITGVLEEIVKEDVVLKERVKECIVIYNYPKNCLVPAAYFNPALSGQMIDIIHGDINPGTTLHEPVKGWDIYNIYRIPHELQAFFQRFFQCNRAVHFYSLWLECQYPSPHDQPDGVSIIFYTNEILAVVFADGQLQLIQSFNYRSAEDIAWHLLNLYKRFHLNKSQTPLVIGGMIAQNSAMYQELLKYFLQVTTYPLPEGLMVTEQFQSFPEHFFSPLLKIAICVL